MVDEPVGLGEVAVTVDVVTVLDVEGLQVGSDLGHRLARLQLVVHPDRQRVTHQRLGGVAHDPAAVVASVERLVVGDLHPLGDIAGDRVAAGRLALVVGAHPVEVHVLVVRTVVVGLPQRAVVTRAVRLRDLVVQRPVEPLRLRVRERRGRGVAEARVGEPGVTELREHDEDAVGALVPSLTERSSEVERLTLQDALERLLLLGVALGLDRQRVLRQVSGAAALGRSSAVVLPVDAPAVAAGAPAASSPAATRPADATTAAALRWCERCLNGGIPPCRQGQPRSRSSPETSLI